MYLSVTDIRQSTKGLSEDADSGVKDAVIQSFIEEEHAFINQKLNRRYIAPMVRTPVNQIAWNLLKKALGHYVRARIEEYLKIQQPVGEDDLQVVDSSMEKKKGDEIMKGIGNGEIVLMGLERNNTEVSYNMRKSPFEDRGDPPWW